MNKTITTRLPEEHIKGLGKIARIEKLDTSGTIRKLLARAIEEWKKDHAIEKYRDGEFSLGQTVEFAEISPWDFPGLLSMKKVSINLDAEEFKHDLKAIKWKK